MLLGAVFITVQKTRKCPQACLPLFSPSTPLHLLILLPTDPCFLFHCFPLTYFSELNPGLCIYYSSAAPPSYIPAQSPAPSPTQCDSYTCVSVRNSLQLMMFHSVLIYIYFFDSKQRKVVGLRRLSCFLQMQQHLLCPQR